MSQILLRGKFNELIAGLLSGGSRVIAPIASVNGRYFYREISDTNTVNIDPNIKPTNSVKEFFFPQNETICNYRYEGKELIVDDAEPFLQEQVIFGVRPCEAASLPILDKVFGWDYQDRFFQQRRAKSTVISIACKPDEFCFCTSVGLSSETDSGADAMLIPIDADTFEVRVFTPKGAAIFDGKTTESDKIGITADSPEIKFDSNNVKRYLAEHFGDDVFDVLSIRCLACGACTYVCPTCHCFDIVDEGGAVNGKRVKNWDACQFAMFTLHASGHNPRGNQSARQRNRIQHKFRIYPDKFGAILCTGCGNCARECSVTLGVRPYVESIDKKSKK
jgi:ferredoxin